MGGQPFPIRRHLQRTEQCSDIVLCCAVLCCAVLCCAVLCCAAATPDAICLPLVSVESAASCSQPVMRVMPLLPPPPQALDAPYLPSQPLPPCPHRTPCYLNNQVCKLAHLDPFSQPHHDRGRATPWHISQWPLLSRIHLAHDPFNVGVLGVDVAKGERWGSCSHVFCLVCLQGFHPNIICLYH